jgi:hypothetical protein
MLNIAETLNRWCREARPFVLAQVVDGPALLWAGRSARVMVGGSGGRMPRTADRPRAAPAHARLRRGRFRHRAQPALSARGRERLNYHPSRPHPEC